MLKFFSAYTNTVRKMIKGYNMDLYNLFRNQNIKEVWKEHDNWNGGIDYYDITVSVPVGFFENLRNKDAIEETERVIKGFYMDAMRGDGESIQLNSVILEPTAEDVSIFGENVDDSMWKPGFFRLFINHRVENKELVSNLKHCLYDYGIDCFVAHEDISPSKEWELEIEKALFTMDALCAIVTPDFIKSHWCDQEVGIALGQGKLVIPEKKEEDPYGFFGKYQAIGSRNKTAYMLAADLWNVLYKNEMTREIYLNKFVELILKSTVKNEALKYIEIIKQFEGLDKRYVEKLHENYNSNIILNSKEVIDSINPLFQKYGLMPLFVTSFSTTLDDNTDLPF